jgi:hypothetical protein
LHPINLAATALVHVGKPPRGLIGGHPVSEPEIMTRRKIWDLDGSLHCSVIGTCLTTGELRSLVRKFHAPLGDKLSDHELHTIAVSALSHRDLLAKQIQKALDHRHAACIRQFAKAESIDDLRSLWSEARQAGDIPAAYWAALTHPRTTDSLIRLVFGDVHMLSHLVGAANRADIRRLHQLEEEKASLEDKLARQQTQLRDGILARDGKIRELTTALSAQIGQRSDTHRTAENDSEIGTLHALVADLRKLLDREIQRRERAEKRNEELTAASVRHERRRVALEEEAAALRAELEAVETQFTATQSDDTLSDGLDLAGATLLYVGGRPHQIARLRAVIEQSSGHLIHHDGGIEERADLLPGLVSRADAAFFPVDCVSHRAALTLKRLCQQSGKSFVPLRSASLASMLRALRSDESGLIASSRSAAE